jgi:septation ring formation regulator EzrA
VEQPRKQRNGERRGYPQLQGVQGGKMKCRLLSAIVLLSFALSPLYSQQQTLSNINTSLDELEKTLLDIQSENESLKADTQALQRNLTESETANERLSNLSAELRRLSTEQQEAYRRQSDLLDTSERRLKRWRLTSLIEGAALIACVFIIPFIK